MRIVKLNLKTRSYNIIIGYNIINLLGKFVSKLHIGSDAYVITNARIKNKYGKMIASAFRQSGFNARFKTIPDTEESKSMEMSSLLIKDIARYDKKRETFIVAFGGGVVGDVAGFVASLYKRGVPYIQVPTTLLAQVDSAIGGKTAVDLSEGKNLVGAFYQPKLVFSDIKFLNSLNKRQMRSGLAEVIKYAIIKDRQLFAYLEKNSKHILRYKPSALEYIVGRSSSIKARIVGLDEREEKGLRTILNFGHTIGHAIEAAGSFRAYNHGEAIALGMLVACDIGRSLNLTDDSVCKRVKKLIKAVGLPTLIQGVSLGGIINTHYRDKKFRGKINRFVLITGIGRTKIAENIPLTTIREAIKKRF